MIGKVLHLVSMILVWTVAAAPWIAYAQHPPSREFQIKAAFLYNFTKFIEWPAEAFPEGEARLIICALGESPVGVALQYIKDKPVKGRTLITKRLQSVRELRSCHLVFVSSTEKDRLSEIFESLKDSSVLTVGEMEGFIQSGGIINFIIRKNRIRFEINPDAAGQAGLKISSNLLKLATVVRPRRRGE